MTNIPTPAPAGKTVVAASYPTASVTAIDWVAKGKVGPIKDQQICGSCWAFSAVGTIESNVAIKKSTIPGKYSEQQLVDCLYPNGCNGGWPATAMSFILYHGLASSAYAYTAVGSICKETSYSRGRFLKSPGFNYISSTNSAVAAQLLKGPISVCVDASKWGPYASGVFKCTTANINHAVVLVGVSSTGTWKLRNSWGSN